MAIGAGAAISTALMALEVWFALRHSVGGGSQGGGGLWTPASSGPGVTFMGASSVLELIGMGMSEVVQRLFGDIDDVDVGMMEQLVDEIEAMVSSGGIDMAGARRGDDSGAMPSIFIWDLAGNVNRGRPFMNWRYISSGLINATRQDERTKSFRGRGGRRQARTK